MKKYIFPILVALAALLLAGAAAFFSVTGLSKLFGGAKMEVIIMASALEFAKIITASFVHRYWKSLKWHMKTYLIIGIVTVMMITSAGIYGFLSNAYATTSGKLQNIEAQVKMVDQKKNILTSEISRIEENKHMKSDRVKSLIALRTQQEARVDSLYNRRQINAAKRVEIQIEQANSEIGRVNIEIDTLNNQVQRKYGQISNMDLEVLNLNNNDVNGEVGPLKYIAKLTGRDMDAVVNFFIIMLIFVFDPLAISLVIATNMAIEKELGGSRMTDLLKKKEEPNSKNEMLEAIEENFYKDPQEELAKASQEALVETSQEEGKVAKEKTEQFISYVPDETGNFKAIKEEPKIDEAQKLILDEIKSQGIEHNASYLSFLEVLFKGGSLGVGDSVLPWRGFLAEIKMQGFKYTEKEVRDFITICNLFKITDMSDKKKATISKDYTVSKQIISLLSK